MNLEILYDGNLLMSDVSKGQAIQISLNGSTSLITAMYHNFQSNKRCFISILHLLSTKTKYYPIFKRTNLNKFAHYNLLGRFHDYIVRCKYVLLSSLLNYSTTVANYLLRCDRNT